MKWLLQLSSPAGNCCLYPDSHQLPSLVINRYACRPFLRQKDPTEPLPLQRLGWRGGSCGFNPGSVYNSEHPFTTVESYMMHTAVTDQGECIQGMDCVDGCTTCERLSGGLAGLQRCPCLVLMIFKCCVALQNGFNSTNNLVTDCLTCYNQQ